MSQQVKVYRIAGAEPKIYFGSRIYDLARGTCIDSDRQMQNAFDAARMGLRGAKIMDACVAFTDGKDPAGGVSVPRDAVYVDAPTPDTLSVIVATVSVPDAVLDEYVGSVQTISQLL